MIRPVVESRTQLVCTRELASTGTCDASHRAIPAQVYYHGYKDKAGGTRLRYGTDERSTRAHLRTASALHIPAVAFWTWNSIDDGMHKAALEWVAGQL